MTPISPSRKRIKLTLDPIIYKAFGLLCHRRGYGHPGWAVEAFMVACLRNWVFLDLAFQLARERGAEGS